MILVGLAIVCAFSSLVTSAMSASEAHKADVEKAKKYATASSILSGVVVVLLIICVGMSFMEKGSME